MNTSDYAVPTVADIPPISGTDNNKLVKLIIDIAGHMLACGGEVSRIEETVNRLCAAYGSKQTDVFCITSVIIVTTIWENGEIITQSRRLSQGSRNYSKLEKLNALSRELCNQKPSIDIIENKISEIENMKQQSRWYIFIGSILAAGGFAVFFGGSLADALAAALCGIVVFLIDQFIYNNKMNKVVYYTMCSFVVGVIAVLLVKMRIGHSIDKILIGCIMLLIPGLNLTTAIEDALIGDTATGALRIYESVVIACAIACGFTVAVIFF